MLANPTNWLRDKETKKPIKYTGKVVANNDPLKLGRITVRIVEYYGDVNQSHIPDEDLPWINMRTNSFLGYNTEVASFSVPEIGSTVEVEYPMSDPYFGYYVGASINVNNRNDAFDEDYPNTYGFIDSLNNYFKINKVKETIELKHSSGTYVRINQDGTIDVSCKDYNVNAEDVTFNCSTFNINTGVTSIVSPAINMTGNINQTGSGISSGDWVSGGISQAGHTHPDAQGGSTGPPQ